MLTNGGQMTTIDPKSKIVTLINTFTVKPENQDALIADLNKATEEVMSGFAGFISANIHKGLEPNKVANYAQWQSKEHYMAVLRNPVAMAHMKEAAALAEKFEPILYEVVSSHGTKS
jgi:quinol monooxygenase YgiN